MTCIAAIIHDNKTYLAGERAATEGDFTMPLEKPKVWRRGEYLLGYYGTLYGEIVQNYFDPPKLQGNVDTFMKTTFRKALKEFYAEWDIDDDEKEFGMLICVKNRIYEHNIADMSMTTFSTDFLATGSGGPYAMGSLHATSKQKDPVRRLKLALGAAIEYSNTCRGPIDILTS